MIVYKLDPEYLGDLHIQEPDMIKIEMVVATVVGSKAGFEVVTGFDFEGLQELAV